MLVHWRVSKHKGSLLERFWSDYSMVCSKMPPVFLSNIYSQSCNQRMRSMLYLLCETRPRSFENIDVWIRLFVSDRTRLCTASFFFIFARYAGVLFESMDMRISRSSRYLTSLQSRPIANRADWVGKARRYCLFYRDGERNSNKQR